MNLIRPDLINPGNPSMSLCSSASLFAKCLTHYVFSSFLPETQFESPHENTYCTELAATHFANCGKLSDLNAIYARIIRTRFLDFHPTSFHWNNLIRSYTRLDAYEKALHIYLAMSREGVSPDSYTLPIVFKATCQNFATEMGRQLHSVSIRVGLESNEYCESGLISMYCKAGEMGDAHKMFVKNPERKLGSWNALIAGFSQGGRSWEALCLFLELRTCGVFPDDVTMVSVTSACGSLGDFALALQLHKCVLQAKRFEKLDMMMMNSLIDMYGKCGRMDFARRVFSEMNDRNVSSWTSMIVGYAAHGHVAEALEFFHFMRQEGVRPNHVTFVGVLTACVHGGTVELGKEYFALMKDEYGLVPKLHHYGCMVDLLGRAGLFEEAKGMIKSMPVKANVVIWGSLMGACEKHENVSMGEWVAMHLKELEPENYGPYVVLSNIYAKKGMWEEVERMRVVMKERELAKMPGYSLTEKIK